MRKENKMFQTGTIAPPLEDLLVFTDLKRTEKKKKKKKKKRLQDQKSVQNEKMLKCFPDFTHCRNNTSTSFCLLFPST